MNLNFVINSLRWKIAPFPLALFYEFLLPPLGSITQLWHCSVRISGWLSFPLHEHALGEAESFTWGWELGYIVQYGQRTDFGLETISLRLSAHSPGKNFSVEQRDSACPRRIVHIPGVGLTSSPASEWKLCRCLYKSVLCEFSQVILWPSKVSFFFLGVTLPARHYGNAVVQGFFKILIHYSLHINDLHNCWVFWFLEGFVCHPCFIWQALWRRLRACKLNGYSPAFVGLCHNLNIT